MKWIVTAALAIMLTAGAVRADQPLPQPLQQAGITEHLGIQVPADIRLTDADGTPVEFGSFFDGQRPIVLVMQYYECPMLCGMVMNAVNTALKALPWTVGREYQFVGVSVDPTEGPALAKAKQTAYADAFGRDSRWNFLVGSQDEIRRLADSVGFGFQYDAVTKEYAHAAVITVLTPRGVVSRYLYGIDFKPRDVKLALVEAGEGKIGSVVDRLLLFCYHYDPSSRSYSLMAFRLMQAGGVGIMCALGGLFVRLRRDESKRNREDVT